MDQRFSSRDLFTLPGLMTLARVPLAAVFPRAAKTPLGALAVLGAAATTDMLDGWLARRLGPDQDTRSQAEHEREAEILTRGKGPFV